MPKLTSDLPEKQNREASELPRPSVADLAPPLECPSPRIEINYVDAASEDSFPASDPPSWTVVMGAGSPYRQ